jgi:hypothetical protein
MSLLDELAEATTSFEVGEEPERVARTPLVGPALLSPRHLEAMRRVLARERPPRPEPLPLWVPPTFEDDAIEPLPLWSPPAVTDVDATDPLDGCPNCGEAVEITRIDLTANAGWLRCRACGLRWGGGIGERPHVAAG